MREEIRTFHLTGRGLDDWRPDGLVLPNLPEGMVPDEESIYPACIIDGQIPKRASEVTGEVGVPAGFSADGLVEIHGACLARSRGEARRRFAANLMRCVAILQDLLAVDDQKLTPASAESLSASLGQGAARFLDVSGLLGLVSHRPESPAAMDATRRERCRAALKILEEAHGGIHDWPLIRSFHEGDACADALAECGKQLELFTPVLRAMRIAKLEAVAAYNPATHDEAFERFDWQSAESGEIEALPAIVAVMPDERVAGSAMTSFCRALRSGWPIQILIHVSGCVMDNPGGTIADLGAVALAHRDAFIVQSSLADWDHLTRGLADMAIALRPAVAIVAAPSNWLMAALMPRSRLFPLFCYDGTSLHLQQPEVTVGVEIALLVSDTFRDHFRIIPEDEWCEEQIPLGEYSTHYRDRPPLGVPFIESAGLRLLTTREVVHLRQEREKAWNALVSLAERPAAQRPQEDSARQAFERVLALLNDPESLMRAAG